LNFYTCVDVRNVAAAVTLILRTDVVDVDVGVRYARDETAADAETITLVVFRTLQKVTVTAPLHFVFFFFFLGLSVFMLAKLSFAL
jgi:hypothetical protein